MRVRYSLMTRVELKKNADYIAVRNPQAAAKVLHKVRVTVEQLQDSPKRGRRQRQQDVRKLGVGRFPYNIYYHVNDDEQLVTILNIRRSARRRKYRDA